MYYNQHVSYRGYHGIGQTWLRQRFRHFRHKKKSKKMRFLFGLLLLVLMVGGFIIGILYLIARLLGQINFNPESQAWKKMVEVLRTRLKSQAAGALVPWDREMLSLLSLNREKLKKSTFFNNFSEGMLTTIFQEPVLAFAEQKSGRNAVLIARTSDREFIFRMKGRETEIWLNSQPFGVLVDGSLLAAGRGGRLLGRVDVHAQEAQYPVTLDNKVAASIANPARADSPNPRALTLLRDLTAEEETVLLALTIPLVMG